MRKEAEQRNSELADGLANVVVTQSFINKL
jgi:hypothetical protein